MIISFFVKIYKHVNISENFNINFPLFRNKTYAFSGFVKENNVNFFFEFLLCCKIKRRFAPLSFVELISLFSQLSA